MEIPTKTIEGLTLSRLNPATEKHLEKLNGQTERNSHAIIMFKTWGSAAIFVVPIVITIIMRLI